MEATVKIIQQNLTNLLSAAMALKSMLTEEEASKSIKDELEQIHA